jgi:hypothetical protein
MPTDHPVTDPVVRSARREALAVLLIWLAAMAYTVGYCAKYGYGRRLEELTYVLGFPDWVFWGVITPWLVCVAICYAFSYLFMTDEDLGAEVDEDEDNAEVTDA